MSKGVCIQDIYALANARQHTDYKLKSRVKGDISCFRRLALVSLQVVEPNLGNGFTPNKLGTQSLWKLQESGAQFEFLPLTWSSFNGFSKLFFLLKGCFNCHLVKKWVNNCSPCASASAYPLILHLLLQRLTCRILLPPSRVRILHFKI